MMVEGETLLMTLTTQICVSSDPLIVRNVYIEILLLFIMWKVPRIPVVSVKEWVGKV